LTIASILIVFPAGHHDAGSPGDSRYQPMSASNAVTVAQLIVTNRTDAVPYIVRLPEDLNVIGSHGGQITI
jgi:hypothetical protein